MNHSAEIGRYVDKVVYQKESSIQVLVDLHGITRNRFIGFFIRWGYRNVGLHGWPQLDSIMIKGADMNHSTEKQGATSTKWCARKKTLYKRWWICMALRTIDSSVLST